jgi:DNA-binding CsgD family transcriptional regulator
MTNIVVLIKQVPDTWSERKLTDGDFTLDREAADAVLDEINERAVEEALLIKEKEAADGTESTVTVLTAGPEPVQRKAVQQKSLVRLARIESGTTAPMEPQVHLSRLERPPVPAAADDRAAANRVGPESAPLTDKQRSLLLALKDSASVSATAHDLGTSRSNVYASLRRIGRKLDVGSVPELFHLLRSGALDETLEG